MIHASTVAAVMAKNRKAGVSRSPNNGIKFPIILDLTLSLHFPTITTRMKQSTINRSGNGTTSFGGGIHLVPSSLRTFPSSHVLIVGTHAVSSELAS